MRRLYAWVLSWAQGPWALPALFALAFVESSFFPIPPDVLLLAMGISLPTRAFRYALWCTLGSVLGGILGYAIGWAAWSSLEPHVLGVIFSEAKFDYVMGLYREWGAACVFVAAFTPIPYKVFTIAAGVARLDLVMFIAASAVGRGARFFLVAAVIYKFGDRARDLIDRWFNVLTIAAAVLIVLLVAIWRVT